MGGRFQSVSGVVVCLDVTEAVVDEAISMGYNLIVSHHPLLFKGLKSITGNSYVERIVIKAIQHNIAIYAAHTNLDNAPEGVSSKLRDRECLIMELRFGLNGRKEHTQKQVADKLGISQSYISRLEKKIIRQLKIELDKAV